MEDGGKRGQEGILVEPGAGRRGRTATVRGRRGEIGLRLLRLLAFHPCRRHGRLRIGVLAGFHYPIEFHTGLGTILRLAGRGTRRGSGSIRITAIARLAHGHRRRHYLLFDVGRCRTGARRGEIFAGIRVCLAIRPAFFFGFAPARPGHDLAGLHRARSARLRAGRVSVAARLAVAR